MFTLIKPSEADVISYLLAQQNEPFSYDEVGASRAGPPSGFLADRHRVLIGHGEEAFLRAKVAVRNWKMFPQPMTKLFWPDKPIEAGTLVAVLARGAGVWSLNPCRIVYTVDDPVGESSSTCRFGFAYGTLPDHAECGEERFLVEWDRLQGDVWYDLFAFSRPQQILSRVGFALVRSLQAKFRCLSGQAMQTAVAGTADLSDFTLNRRASEESS